MKPVSFFVDTVTIIPHSATLAANIGKPTTIAEFAKGEPVSLYETEQGELLCSKGKPGTSGYESIEGHEKG